jgi:hypothetical protein
MDSYFDNLGGVYLISDSTGVVQLLVPNRGNLTSTPLIFLNKPEDDDFYEEEADSYESEYRGDIFWQDYVFYDSSTPKLPFNWNEAHTKLISVKIGQYFGFINHLGEVEIPGQFQSILNEFNGWTANVVDSNGNRFIIDRKGNSIVGGWLVSWVSSNTFLYMDENTLREYTSNKQSAEGGKIIEICSNCSLDKVVAPGIYEVQIDNFKGYIVVRNNQPVFLGEYLQSSYRAFKIKYDMFLAEYKSTSANYYDISLRIKELNAPLDLKYEMALMKLRIAIDLNYNDLLSVVRELEGYNEFVLEDKIQVYDVLINHFTNNERYSYAANYLMTLNSLIGDEKFVEEYGIMAGKIYFKINDYSRAKTIFKQRIL